MMLAGILFSHATAWAQDNYWSTIEVDIIIYDENAREQLPLPQAISNVPETTSITSTTVTPGTLSIPPTIATLPKPVYPRNLEGKYTEIDKGIPVIINPEPCSANGLDLRITVENITNSKGFIVADLHDDVVEDFLQWDKVLLRIRQAAKTDKVSFCLPLPQPGEYAVAVYHDENNNRDFDKGFLKIPKERFGMSNNPRFGLKSPKYHECKFHVPETGADISVKLVSSSDVLKGKK